MKKASWDSSSYYIDGNPAFLVSGEFHYFRVPRSDWRRRLELFKEAGGNAVATYIPWLIHEPVEGDIRFGDVPERDLEGFLQLCQEVGLLVTCRPGPYQYSELRYDGLPGWLCENYPEIRARNVQGKAFRTSSVSYLHPVFLEKVRRWYEVVGPIIAKYTQPKGGPVAFVQFDNELMGIHQWFSGWDYHEVSMGFGVEEGRYPRFVQKRYRTIEHLNTAYGTSFSDFLEVRPFPGGSPIKASERRRVKDYQDFYFETVAEYAEMLRAWLIDLGVDCDMVHNSPNPASNSQFKEMVERLGKGFILGSDHYYTLGSNWEQNNPTPQYVSKVFYSNEMLRLMGFPPTIFELPGGSCSDWPPITPEDLRACYLSNIALGMKGFNYYIFTGGVNPFDSGAFGDVYDYGASIGADGTIRPTYAVQKEFGNFLKEHSWLEKAEKAADFHIGIDFEYSRSHSYFSQQGEYEFTSTQAWDFMREGVLYSALCGSYSPNMVDLSSDSLLDQIDTPMVVVSSVTMAEAVQKRLVEFVRRGGQLLICPVIPYLDEDFNPCTHLKDFLGGITMDKCPQYAPMVTVGDVHNVLMNGSLYQLRNLPGDGEVIGMEERSQAAVGWKKVFSEGGQVVCLGFQWRHAMFEHSKMLTSILRQLGCGSPVIECSNPNVWTALRRAGEQEMLFVMNLYSAPMEAQLRVKKEDGSSIDMGLHRLDPMEVKTLYVE